LPKASLDFFTRCGITYTAAPGVAQQTLGEVVFPHLSRIGPFGRNSGKRQEKFHKYSSPDGVNRALNAMNFRRL
jgi:hypothetical protein